MIHSKDQEKETDTTHLMHNVRINFLTLKLTRATHKKNYHILALNILGIFTKEDDHLPSRFTEVLIRCNI